MFLLFIIIPLLLLIPVCIYMYFWFGRLFSLFPGISKRTGNILSAVFGFLCLYVSWPMYQFGGMIIIHFLVVSILIDIIYKIVRKRSGEISEKWDKVYRSGIISVVVVLVIITYGYINMHHIKETRYEITSGKVEGSLRIAAVSDLHLGTNMDADGLSGYCSKIEDEKPDVFVLAGDIFDENTKKEEMQKAAEIFASVKSRYGTYYVLGNHDPNNYVSNPEYSVEGLCGALEEAGVVVLRDEVENLEGLTIVGRRDASSAERKSTWNLTEAADKENFILLLDHQPLRLKENAESPVDLQISGHTHGGQIWPTGILMQLLGVSELNYGYKKIENMDVIVTSGIGGWGYPIRTGKHCEYIIVDVHA